MDTRTFYGWKEHDRAVRVIPCDSEDSELEESDSELEESDNEDSEFEDSDNEDSELEESQESGSLNQV